ncbi:hypothetical protein C8N29_1065 [Agitococcus lubricus]|uniref:Uncharacterized protein n=1 Tax=Agitococcus lubricus TaxID=1077255 RepID=A0A2T5IZR3_9GAMM|nr:hypothetical protein C8N29_1065 [Agitococcus lubricus]
MSDGMSEGVTDGFIDVNDCPPWDIWIGYIAVNRNRYVLSWIPNQLIGLVEEAIFVNCSGSLYWLEDCDEIWANELRLLLSKH